jgi:3-methyladenine DNA glycosylase AlkD
MSPVTVSPTTEASNRFVAAHLAQASALGEQLADLVQDPGAFVAAIADGFADLGDPVYAEGSRSIAPGLGPILGVRLPLMEATNKAFKRGTRQTSTSLLGDAADRLLRQELRELRWFGIWNLGRLLPTDSERAWQLLRRAAGEADEWITVDTLAHPYGEGILLDTRRWAEIEQLVFSPSRWERRLVGSTIATMPHVRDVPGGKSGVVVERGLALIGQLIGDAEPDVEKALSWALRTLSQLDPAATARFLGTEAETARTTDDGHRAWVIRDSVSKLPAETAVRLRASLDRIRRRPGVPSTSRAAATAAAFLTRLPGGTLDRPAANALRRNTP